MEERIRKFNKSSMNISYIQYVSSKNVDLRFCTTHNSWIVGFRASRILKCSGMEQYYFNIIITRFNLSINL